MDIVLGFQGRHQLQKSTPSCFEDAKLQCRTVCRIHDLTQRDNGLGMLSVDQLQHEVRTLIQAAGHFFLLLSKQWLAFDLRQLGILDLQCELSMPAVEDFRINIKALFKFILPVIHGPHAHTRGKFLAQLRPRGLAGVALQRLDKKEREFVDMQGRIRLIQNVERLKLRIKVLCHGALLGLWVAGLYTEGR